VKAVEEVEGRCIGGTEIVTTHENTDPPRDAKEYLGNFFGGFNCGHGEKRPMCRVPCEPPFAGHRRIVDQVKAVIANSVSLQYQPWPHLLVEQDDVPIRMLNDGHQRCVDADPEPGYQGRCGAGGIARRERKATKQTVLGIPI